MTKHGNGRDRKTNVYRFDAARKKKARTTFDGDRMKLEPRRTGKRRPRGKRAVHPLVVFAAVVLALTLISRWFGQLGGP